MRIVLGRRRPGRTVSLRAVPISSPRAAQRVWVTSWRAHRPPLPVGPMPLTALTIPRMVASYLPEGTRLRNRPNFGTPSGVGEAS